MSLSVPKARSAGPRQGGIEPVQGQQQEPT